MPPTVFFAVLAAALLHASWNAVIKFGASKISGVLVMTVIQGSAGLIIALTRPFPGSEVWPWLLASGVLHAAYKLFLGFAYEQGDLSRVYPIARGAAPMMVLLVSATWGIDALTGAELLGILILGGGIALMARGVFTSGESRRLLPFALASAVATAGYSLIDGMGARIGGDPVAFVGWMFALDMLFFTPISIALRGPGIARVSARGWMIGGVAAAGSYGAYAIAVWAMTQAPIALVTALRETSILFAMVIGVLLFRERLNLGKIAAGALILTGVILTRI